MHRRTQLLCAIGVSLWFALPAGSQSTDGGVLSRELRDHLQAESFGIVTAIRGLPLGVRDALQRLWGSATLDIANPGDEFQSTPAAANPKPTRRLIAAGCSNDQHCLVYYERGGSDRTWLVVLYHWTPDETRFEWGSTAPAGLATIDDVRKAIVSGAMKGPARTW